jgi:hypothetical protein
MKAMLKILVTAIIAFTLVLSGCVEEDTTGDDDETPPATGTLTFQVADKITEDFDHVNVTFSEIRLFYQNDSDNESYESIMSDPTTVDLIYLNLSQVNATLGVAEIEVGNYSKLWINVTNVTGVLNATGETVNITVPSGWLKIQQLHLFNITRGNHTITVDIDVEGSIHTFHGGTEYKFIPVISWLDHRHEKQLKFREHNKSRIKQLVGNRAPAIDIYVNETVVKNNIRLDGNISYEFNASATLDLDGDPLNFTWDFGDGTNVSYGAVVFHTYPEGKANYQVWLTVSDGEAEGKEHFVVKIDTGSGGSSNGNNGNNGNGNGQGQG